MRQLNLWIGEGNATRDPEARSTPNGKTVAKIGIAVNRSWKKDGEWQKETDFFEVEAWGSVAELVAQHVRKGTAVRVVGRLKQDRWEKDGVQRSMVKIVADTVDWVWPKRDEAGSANTQDEAPAQSPDNFQDDIPF